VNEASGGNIFKGVDPDLVWESKEQNKRSLVAQGFSGLQVMERVMGIEPTSQAWEFCATPPMQGD